MLFSFTIFLNGCKFSEYFIGSTVVLSYGFASSTLDLALDTIHDLSCPQSRYSFRARNCFLRYLRYLTFQSEWMQNWTQL